MTENWHEFLHKEMSRKDFIKTLGLGLAAVLGLSTVLHLMGVKHPLLNSGTATSGRGFGGGPYGI